jgi:hypothetical protein
MRSLLISIQLPFLIFLASYSCRKETSQPVLAQSDGVQVVRDTTKLIEFDKDIVPLLKGRCSPCHFPGGKMYEKMPFDQAKTISDHRAGVTKRFKDQELDRIKAYLDQAAR